MMELWTGLFEIQNILESGICGLGFCSTIELISQREPSLLYTSVAAHCGGLLCSSSLNEFTMASNCAQSALCDDPLPRSSHILSLTGSSF